MSWNSDALFAKAALRAQETAHLDAASPDLGLAAALALELLARAALAHVSPTLLAEADESQRNILYALERPVPKFTPRSIITSKVFTVCTLVVPEFTEDDRKLCQALTERRNEELHSGGSAFASYPSEQWRIGFYRACQKLCKSMSRDLGSLFGVEHGAAVEEALASDAGAVLSAVKKRIAAHKTIWEALPSDEQAAKIASTQIQVPKYRMFGHVIVCPACASSAVVLGNPMGPSRGQLEDGDMVERVQMLPYAFRCEACGLSLPTRAEVLAADLGAPFTNTSRMDPVDYFAGEPDYYEEDNNE